MWKLVKIESENIVSFHGMSYEIAQGKATLIFGQNNDSDKQKNNGSGKSSFIEAIAFCITGDPLRKVNIDDIINDYADDAWVRLTFIREDAVFELYRSISRSSGQAVRCKMFSPTTGQEIRKNETIQPSILEYNRYILETLGISKNDLYNSYILCSNKYKSFFRASDREKKEIINRFSNGVLVDESIQKLLDDIEPLSIKTDEKSKDVSVALARIDTIKEQMENAEMLKISQKIEREKRIEALNEKISEKKVAIGQHRQNIRTTKEKMNAIIDVENEMVELEKTDYSLECAFQKIKNKTLKVGITIDEYGEKLKQYTEDIENCAEQYANKKAQIAEFSKTISGITEELDNIQTQYENALSEDVEKNTLEDNEIRKIADNERELKEKIQDIRGSLLQCEEKSSQLNKRIVELEHILHGTITCPNCSHKFLLNSEISVDEAMSEISEKRQDYERTCSEYSEYNEELGNAKDLLEKYHDKRDAIQSNHEKRASAISDIYIKLIVAKRKIAEMNLIASKNENELKAIQNTIEEKTKAIDNLKKLMFDSVYDLIDAALANCEAYIKNENSHISMEQANIEIYQKSIDEQLNPTSDDMLGSLNKSLEKYKKEHEKASKKFLALNGELELLKAQVKYFIEFKGHLANTKIDAIAKITNSFLQQIGSDLRVELSGYKVLKSGKIRDNITIKVLRNGIDCGNFDKLSGGEKARVCLANILAMHYLTNINCSVGKGLDILIIDEVLDCSDESGISSYCDVFNQLGVTSMIITQGLVSESYPYKMLIIKENGVSSIKQ